MFDGAVHSTMVLNLVSEEYDRLNTASLAGSFVNKLDTGLNILSGAISTDYICYEDLALTNNYLLLVAEDFVVKYENPYQGYMEPVPEPTNMTFFAFGAFLIRSRKRY